MTKEEVQMSYFPPTRFPLSAPKQRAVIAPFLSGFYQERVWKCTHISRAGQMLPGHLSSSHLGTHFPREAWRIWTDRVRYESNHGRARYFLVFNTQAHGRLGQGKARVGQIGPNCVLKVVDWMMEEGDVRKSKSNISKSWKNPFADVGLKQPLL